MTIRAPPAIPPSLSRVSRRIPANGGPGLDYFITRAKVLSLYREIQRTLNRVQDARDRKELQEWARADFERYRFESDPDKIKSLLSQGKHQFHTLQTSLSLSSGNSGKKKGNQ